MLYFDNMRKFPAVLFLMALLDDYDDVQHLSEDFPPPPDMRYLF